MPEQFSITVTGVSGKTYTYYSTPPNPTWQATAGNYLFCREENGLYHVKYAGQCDDFSNRIPNHERLVDGKKDFGVTHIFSRINGGGEKARKTEEQDIIQAYNPPMNVHHRTNESQKQRWV